MCFRAIIVPHPYLVAQHGTTAKVLGLVGVFIAVVMATMYGHESQHFIWLASLTFRRGHTTVQAMTKLICHKFVLKECYRAGTHFPAEAIMP